MRRSSKDTNFAVEADRVLGPHPAEQVDGLVEPLPAIVELVAEGGVLCLRPPDPDGDGHPTTGQGVDAGEGVGQLQGVVGGHDQHARAEADALGGGRRPGQGDQRVEQVRGGIGLGRRMHDVVADPQVVEAELLGVGRRPRDGLGPRHPSVLG